MENENSIEDLNSIIKSMLKKNPRKTFVNLNILIDKVLSEIK
jgi:hypothetical protein